MPAANVKCPGCQTSLKLPGANLAGKQMRCPKCGSRFTVPPAPAAVASEAVRPAATEESPVRPPNIPRERRERGADVTSVTAAPTPKKRGSFALAIALGAIVVGLLVCGGGIVAGILYIRHKARQTVERLQGLGSGSSSSVSSGTESVPPLDPDEVAKQAKEREKRRQDLATDERKFLNELAGTAASDEDLGLRSFNFESGRTITSMAASRDGKLLALAFDPNRYEFKDKLLRFIKLLDARTFEEKQHVECGKYDIHGMVFNEEGTRLIFVDRQDEKRCLRFWNVETGNEVTRVPLDHGGAKTELAPDGKTLAVMGDGIELWDITTATKRTTLRNPDDLFAGYGALAFSPDGRLLAWADINKRITIWDLTAGRKLHFLNTPGTVAQLAFSPDGSKLVAAALGDDPLFLEVWDPHEGTRIKSVPSARRTTSMVFSTDGKALITGAYDIPDSHIVAYDSATWELLRAFASNALSGQFPGLCLSAGGQFLYTAIEQQRLEIWDVKDALNADGARSEAVLSKLGGEMKALRDGYVLKLKRDAGDADLARLKDATRLIGLEVTGDNITDTGLAHLKNLPNLRQLRLVYLDKVTDAGLVHLKDMKNLKALQVFGSKFTADGLANLRGLVNLEDLELAGMNVGDDGMRHLADLTRLRLLDLGTTQISDIGLQHLKKMTGLKKLLLAGNQIEGHGLAHLRPMTELEVVALGGNPLTDEGLMNLKDCTKIQELNIAGTWVTDAGFAALAKMSRLRELTISVTFFHAGLPAFQGAGLQHLAEKPSLVELDLRETRLQDQELVRLKVLPQLKRLRLPATVTDDGIVHLKALVNLEELDLSTTGITDAGLAHVSACPKLANLDLTDTDVTAACFAHLKALQALSRLTLDQTDIDDAALEKIGELKKLTSLQLSKTLVSADGFAKLKQTLPNVFVSGKPDDNHQARIRRSDLAALAKIGQLNRFNDTISFYATDKTTDENLARLKAVPDLTALHLHGDQLTDAALVHVKGLTKLRELTLHGKFGDAGIENIKSLSNLETLTLGGLQSLTDKGLVHLKELAKLKHLDLSNTSISAAGLAHLAGLTSLESLTLNDVKVTDDGLKHLAGLTALKTLVLWRSGIGDAGLVNLKNLTNMVHLYLADNELTGDGLVHLRGMSQLETLDLAGTKLQDPGLEHAGALKNLRVLGLQGTAVTDAGFAHLSGLKNLATVETGGVKGLKGPGLKHLAALPELKYVNLAGTGVTDEGLQSLKEWMHLESLYLPDGISDAGFAHLAGLTKLKYVAFNTLPDLKGPGLKHLRTLKELTALHLENTSVRDEGLQFVAELTQLTDLSLHPDTTDAGLVHLKNLTELRTLSLAGCKITDAGLAKLKHLTRLESLILNNTPIMDAGLVHLKDLKSLLELSVGETKITDAGLEHLAGLEKLRYLDLHKTQTTQKGADKLKQALPQLEINRGE